MHDTHTEKEESEEALLREGLPGSVETMFNQIQIIMRQRIKTMKALCATSAFGDSRVKTLMECPPIRKKTIADKEKELKEKMRAVLHREKFAVKDGKIFILTHHGKGMMGQGILY